MDPELEQRIIDLEIHVAHQSDTIDSLNSVVTQQGQIIDRLVNSIRQMKDQVLDLQDLLDQVPENQRPPHY